MIIILDDTLIPGHKKDYHKVVISCLKTLWGSVHCVLVPKCALSSHNHIDN